MHALSPLGPNNHRLEPRSHGVIALSWFKHC